MGEWVQVHPTGLVKPDDPDAKVKFLAAEALRGVGGLVFDANGKRFANELGRRDYVAGEMWKNKPPFRLCLNKAASDEIIWHCKHYTGRGVMKYYKSGEELAKDMGVPLQTLVDSHEGHYQAAKKQEKDPDGGNFPAYPSAKTCQVCTLLARPLGAFTETIALVATLSSIAWSSVAWLAARHRSTCSAQTANSGCTHLTLRISSSRRSLSSDVSRQSALERCSQRIPFSLDELHLVPLVRHWML